MLPEALEVFVPVLNSLCLLCLVTVFYNFPPVLSQTSRLLVISVPKTSPTYQTRQEPDIGLAYYNITITGESKFLQSTRMHRELGVRRSGF